MVSLEWINAKGEKDGRALAYDTQHPSSMGPCHRHCCYRIDAEKMNLDNCNFMRLLKLFCTETKVIAQSMGYISGEDEWNCP